jgi:hypothetical protein
VDRRVQRDLLANPRCQSRRGNVFPTDSDGSWTGVFNMTDLMPHLSKSTGKRFPNGLVGPYPDCHAPNHGGPTQSRNGKKLEIEDTVLEMMKKQVDRHAECLESWHCRAQLLWTSDRSRASHYSSDLYFRHTICQLSLVRHYMGIRPPLSDGIVRSRNIRRTNHSHQRDYYVGHRHVSGISSLLKLLL